MQARIFNLPRHIKSSSASINLTAFEFNARVCPVLSYHAQLLPLDTRHFVLERIALHTVLRAPWNSFRHSDFFQLHKYGGPKLRSPNIACASALYRTAAKTVSNWGHWVMQMKVVADEHVGLAQLVGGAHYPKCWDSPPLAHNLMQAYEGFTSQSKFSGAAQLIRDKLATRIQLERGTSFPSPGSKVFLAAKSLQSVVYEAIKEFLFPNKGDANLASLCAVRWPTIFSPYDPLNGQSPAYYVGRLKEVKGSVAMKVIKTWFNGWATSQRMHEDVTLCCLLGCHGAEDKLSHYAQCPYLYAMLKFLFSNMSDCPLTRFGLGHADQTQLKILACTFSAYHALKAQYRSGKIQMHQDVMTNASMRHNWSVFAHTLCAEAGEQRIPHYAFSLTKFICFLTTGIRGETVQLSLVDGSTTNNGSHPSQGAVNMHSPSSSSAADTQTLN